MVFSSMRVAFILFVGIINFNGIVVDSFANQYGTHPSSLRQGEFAQSTTTSCRMVRNIDMVEALIFYGASSVFHAKDQSGDDDTRVFLPGVKNLLDECKRDDTAVLAILEDGCEGNVGRGKNDDLIVYKTETSPAPNPRDLWEAIHSVQVSPKGFGGSSGFGRKPADPERSPVPAHCVVLCDTVERCRAARFAGMRVLCLTDNELADGVMNFGVEDINDLDYYWESINMDDIAMPGSFWLNPPHPKDDEGNGVDVLSVIESYEEKEREQNNQLQTTEDSVTTPLDPEDDDRYLASILMDIDPL